MTKREIVRLWLLGHLTFRESAFLVRRYVVDTNFAHGGIVSAPRIVLVGEKGPEHITPLRDRP